MNFALILFLATRPDWQSSPWPTGCWLARQRGADVPEPWWIEYPKSFFPVLLIVFLLRSFVTEPFKIPSSSMRPTLEVGDFILVNKFTYGIRLPVIEQKIIAIGDPAARRRDGVPLSRQSFAGLHQARGRASGRRGGVPRQEADGQRRVRFRSSRTAPTAISKGCASRPPSVPSRPSTPATAPRSTRSPSIPAPRPSIRRTCARSLGARTAITMTAASRCKVPRRPLLHDGRQPRQQR